MITITRQELIDFIKRQPDEKEFWMDQSTNQSSCGCLMVQYGREQNWDFEGCGFTSWWSEADELIAQIPFNIFSLAPNVTKNTYGETKKFLGL